jgi:Skp family chaperone for outer membrane proteins
MDEELKSFSKDAEKKLFQKETTLLQPMNDKINKAVESVALKQGYLQIIDIKLTYFSLPACDATKLVIDEANK